jgi:hypothetical protein
MVCRKSDARLFPFLVVPLEVKPEELADGFYAELDKTTDAYLTPGAALKMFKG